MVILFIVFHNYGCQVLKIWKVEEKYQREDQRNFFDKFVQQLNYYTVVI
jgi:hypothetical protein